MKFIATHQNFLQGLNLSERVIGKNFSLPILQNILISCEKSRGAIKIASTDLEMGVEVFIPAKVEEEGSVTIPAKLVNSFVRGLPEEKIEFSEKNKKILLLCKNYKANINGEDPKEFPIIPQNKGGESFSVKSAAFLSGINPVVSSASQLDIKPEISGVYIQLKEDSSCFTATDSFRLAEKIVKNASKNSYLNNVILPKRTCDALVKIFGDSPKDDLSVQIHNNQMTVKNSPEEATAPRVSFVSKVIDGEYPKYEQIIPASFTTSVRAPKAQLARHIRTAGLFSSKIREVTLSASPKRQLLEITSKDADYGDHHSTLPCEVEGEEVHTVLNFEYLLDGIGSVLSEDISLKINQPATPVLISSVENEGFRYILMPIKR